LSTHVFTFVPQGREGHIDGTQLLLVLLLLLLLLLLRSAHYIPEIQNLSNQPPFPATQRRGVHFRGICPAHSHSSPAHTIRNALERRGG
jgi:hypothetical protein